MNTTSQLADLLRRLADSVIRPLEGDDPLQLACEEFERIWSLTDTCYDDDLNGLSDDVHKITDELERQIVENIATTKSALIAQARVAQHEQFPDYLVGDLIDTVVQGIVGLVPDKWQAQP